jgi:GT2 family glycosyltransferase
VDLLRKCVESIFKASEYSNLEIFVIDNDSIEPETKEYLRFLQTTGVTVIKHPGKFNFSAICNRAARLASGEYLCFLNNDVQIISPNWISSLVGHASQDGIGLVGAVLLYPDGTLQHLGVALGLNGVAGHPFRGLKAEHHIPKECFEVSAVTFALAVVKRTKFNLEGGLDELLPSGFNDVDFSIRLSQRGLTNVVCTHVHAIHCESQSRPKTWTIAGTAQALRDVLYFLGKHPKITSDKFFT